MKADAPDTHGIIVGSRYDPLPVGAECDGVYIMGMSFELADLLSGLCIPYTHGLIIRCGNDPFPIGAERCGVYRAGMSHKTGHLLACFSIPDADGLVFRCGGEPLPVRAEYGTGNSVGMPPYDRGAFSVGDPQGRLRFGAVGAVFGIAQSFGSACKARSRAR